MTLFSYKAKNAEGKEVEGTREATDRYYLSEALKKEGLTIISAAPKKKARGLNFDIGLPSFGGGVSMQEKIMFARNVSAMLDAGLALSRVLAVLERQTKNKRLKAIIVSLNESVKGGKTLSDSMLTFPKVFPQLFVSMVKAGEEGGRMAEAFRIVGTQMEKLYTLQKKIRGAMIYPAIIICLMAAIGVLMMIFIVPTLTSTFRELNIELPTSTRVIIFISDFLKYHYIFALAFLVAGVLGFGAMMRSKGGRRVVDYVTIRIPLVGEIVKETNAARTTRTLASLLTSGVDYVVAMQITKDVMQNSYYKEVLELAKNRVQKGDPISEIFIKNEQLYPIFVGEMMSVGEETGRISEMMNGVATFYENEVEQKTKDMSTVIEPFLMVLIGGAVGFFAVSMLTPMYSLMNNL